jgi:hypothetical protein
MIKEIGSPGGGAANNGAKNLVSSRPYEETEFLQRPGRAEIPSCDRRRSSDAQDPKPACCHWRNISSEFPALESKMGEVVQFIPKRELERARLIQEARAIYERIFPTQADHKE